MPLKATPALLKTMNDNKQRLRCVRSLFGKDYSMKVFKYLFPLLLLLFHVPSLASYELADTSSPKHTLSSFMHSSELVIKYWQNEQLDDPHAQHALRQTLRTMDLSLLPNRNRTVVVMERVIQLREILDRLEPSSLELTLESDERPIDHLEQWRFAHTDIVISRQLEGDKSGQYLFSASSIQQLPRWYQTMAVFPYVEENRANYHHEFLISPGPLFSKAFILSLPDSYLDLYGPFPLGNGEP
ncbi:hypothetical protein [Vibrio mexicanus]|uniref:hypothetical protein n=1 Tax=Vibrio mexicanus TaxID=1004326 RepID=UPI000AE597DE|nr:hypothetical protein [Vibrio mexicanus]